MLNWISRVFFYKRRKFAWEWRQWAVEQAIRSGSSGHEVAYDADNILKYILAVPRDSTIP